MYKHVKLIKDTSAYKIIKSDRQNDTLSHAYLIIHEDKKYLREYLKTFAKLIACGDEDGRIADLIEAERHLDVKFYPEENKKILVSDVDELIDESYITPYEAGKKIFVLVGADEMNAVSQNKLLKTLEEPPKSIVILLGATNENTLLETVKSRVKKLVIPPFSTDDLIETLAPFYPDRERLKSAIALGGGIVGAIEEVYSGESLSEINSYIKYVLTDLKTSKDVSKFEKAAEKLDIQELISAFKITFSDVILYNQGLYDMVKNAAVIKGAEDAVKEVKDGAALFILEAVAEAEKRVKFNANSAILLNFLLFKILEGKYKWQKL